MVVPFSPKNFDFGFGVCSKSIGCLFKKLDSGVTIRSSLRLHENQPAGVSMHASTATASAA